MDLPTTICLLESAILDVAKSEYARLSFGLTPQQVAMRVGCALESLGQLRFGVPPAYDEWDALFYLTWYQPRQINLTHLVTNDILARNLDHTAGGEPRMADVHVIDFGCGALASRFAFAVSAATRNVSSSNLHVDLHGIDNSEPMVRIGNAMWSKFVESVSDPHLAAVCRSVNCTTYGSYQDYRVSPAAHVPRIYPSPNCYLLAIHTMYESNLDALRETFAAIREERDPACTMITCAASKEGVASQAAGGGFRRLNPIPERMWDGDLQRVSQWRRSLLGLLPTADPILPNFLQPSVQWRPPPGEIRVLMKP